jgi:predicted RNA-binding Zn-ribbon protein involved in translation (DUF1610 family)
MANKRRFQCPYCQAIFAVKALQKRFECPRCGHAFATVRLDGRERGWMALPQVAWERAHSQVVRPFPRRGELHAAPAADEGGVQSPPAGSASEAARTGAARLRRERRRKRKRLALPMALIAMAAVFMALLLYPPGAMGREAGVDGVDPYNASAAPTLAALPSASNTPVATATPTMIATPTATPTPLPPNLAQATAWQATLEQAAADSHATQTLVAGNYAATQTALPPTLTAMAQERQATATQKALEATKRAAGPATR